jgi:hypothetical protein
MAERMVICDHGGSQFSSVSGAFSVDALKDYECPSGYVQSSEVSKLFVWFEDMVWCRLSFDFPGGLRQHIPGLDIRYLWRQHLGVRTDSRGSVIAPFIMKPYQARTTSTCDHVG